MESGVDERGNGKDTTNDGTDRGEKVGKALMGFGVLDSDGAEVVEHKETRNTVAGLMGQIPLVLRHRVLVGPNGLGGGTG